MKKILALETSCEQGSIALWTGEIMHTRQLEGHQNHSERILGEIRALLQEAGLSVEMLDAVAFGQGPGAFTGIRLACGVAQGLAFGAGLSVIPVSSLAALALSCDESQILAATDARMGEVYCAAFSRTVDGQLIPMGECICCAPEAVAVPEGKWVGVGSAFSVYEATLKDRFGNRLQAVHADRVPQAGNIARLALGMMAEGQIYPPEQVSLTYVRNKVAYTTAERLARGGKS